MDRRALPTPNGARPALNTVFATPRTPLEEALATIWAAVLELDEVGIHDNFPELGGHSLLAMQILARVIETCQVEMPLRTLMDTPTIADMAIVITQHQASQADPATVAQMLAEVEALSETRSRQLRAADRNE